METPSIQSTLKWLRVYHVFSFVLGILLTVFMGAIVFIAMGDPAEFSSATEYNIFVVFMLGFLFFMIICSFISLIAAAIVRKKSRVNWIFQIALVVMGFTSIITLIPCIFLFMGLLSEEGKEYYLR